MNKIPLFKKIILIVPVVLLLPAQYIMAQYISLSNTEVQKLITLVKTDPGAKKNYSLIQEQANAALNQKPNPIDTIISEGHLANDPKKLITQKCLADMDKIYALSYTYKVSNNPVYLKKCTEYIVAWASVNRAVANPINNTKLEPLLEAYDLIRDQVSGTNKTNIDTWLVNIADAEIANPRFKSGSKTSYNNWNSHRIKVVGCIAYILNNRSFQVFTDTSIKRQIFRNLYSNGSGVDFEDRDALHYHIYTLEPLLRVAAVIKRATGVNYFTYTSPSGSSIQKSVDFLVPFATGERIHKEYMNTKTPFDKARAANKEAGFSIGADFIPATAIDVFCCAAYFNPSYINIVKKLMDTQDDYPNWQIVLNAAKNTPKIN